MVRTDEASSAEGIGCAGREPLAKGGGGLVDRRVWRRVLAPQATGSRLQRRNGKREPHARRESDHSSPSKSDHPFDYRVQDAAKQLGALGRKENVLSVTLATG
jgi:hypothetical protein